MRTHAEKPAGSQPGSPSRIPPPAAAPAAGRGAMSPRYPQFVFRNHPAPRLPRADAGGVEGSSGPVPAPAPRLAYFSRPAVSDPGDAFELEAEGMADRVMGMSARRVPDADSAAASPPGASAAPRDGEGLVPSGGRPMDPVTREFMESRFGADFGRVRVHTGPEADAAARAVQARAFTLGPRIVFRAGEYAPASPAGRRLLAHELAHVRQQESGRASGVVQRQLYPPIPIVVGRPLPRCIRQLRPSGSASPNTGISVSWTGGRIDIVARVQFSGPGATPQVADAMKRDIERVWNATFADGYASACRVDLVMGGPEDPSRAQIIVGTGGSVQDSFVTGSTMRFMYSGNPADLVWSPSHEFAHLLGLSDRRSHAWYDPLGLGAETSEAGYERNIMGAIPGGDYARRSELVLESRNVRDWLNQFAMETVCVDPGDLEA